MTTSSMAETWNTFKGVVILVSYHKTLKKNLNRDKNLHTKKVQKFKNHKKNVLYRFQIRFPIILLCLILCTKNDPVWILKKTKKI